MLRYALLILLFSSTARAAEPTLPPIEPIPAGEDKIVAVAAGEKAPFDGQLFDNDTALRWGNWLIQYKSRYELDLKLKDDLLKLKLEYKDSLSKIEHERNEALTTDLTKRLDRSETARITAEDEARNPSFWKSLEFGLILGVLATAGGIIAVSLSAN